MSPRLDAVRLAAVLAVVSAYAISAGCTGMLPDRRGAARAALTDSALTANFEQHRAEFASLTAFLSKHPHIHRINRRGLLEVENSQDPSVLIEAGLPSTDVADMNHAVGQLKAFMIVSRVAPGHENRVNITVQRSWDGSKGYIRREEPPDPRWVFDQDLDSLDVPPWGTIYRQLDEHWYIFRLSEEELARTFD